MFVLNKSLLTNPVILKCILQEWVCYLLSVVPSNPVPLRCYAVGVGLKKVYKVLIRRRGAFSILLLISVRSFLSPFSYFNKTLLHKSS